MRIWQRRFRNDPIVNGLGEVLATNGLEATAYRRNRKVRARDLLFSGGREQLYPGEDRVLIPSPKVRRTTSNRK